MEKDPNTPKKQPFSYRKDYQNQERPQTARIKRSDIDPSHIGGQEGDNLSRNSESFLSLNEEYATWKTIMNEKKLKIRRRIMKKVSRKRPTITNMNKSNSNLYESSRSSSKYHFPDASREESNQNVSIHTERTVEGTEGIWDQWWRQKEENENKLKDYITKKDIKGVRKVLGLKH